MTKRSILYHLLFYEIAGYLLIVAMLWLDEVLDLPHLLLGSPATPVNITESAMESVLVLIVAVPVMVVTAVFIRRLKMLEGILPVCAGCKKVRVGDEWWPPDEYVSAHTEADVSHGLCPTCMVRYYGDIPIGGKHH